MIQSLSIVVPSKSCINKCEFCVARMIDDTKDYKNQMDENLPFYDLYLKDYLKRLEYARDNGVNTVMLTGNCEPQQNRKFLTHFGMFMMMMDKPFRNIEMQTTGVLLDKNYLRFLRNHVGVNTISLSISSFDLEENQKIIGAPQKIYIQQLCEDIKNYDFNLRLSLNLNKSFDMYSAEKIFGIAKTNYLADQITFRVLYTGVDDTPQSKWIMENSHDPNRLAEIRQYIKDHGVGLEVLPFGYIKYSVNGMSTVLDDDSMNSSAKEDLKYFILRPNCKLYSKWDDTASLVF